MFASFVQGPLVRVIPLGLILLALQRTIFVEIQVGGVIIQLMMAMAAAAGVAGGSERGAIVGFTLGLMFDLAEGTPLGSTATAMAAAAGVAGGSERGAIVGFTLGLMFDLAEGTPLGSTATAMTIAGAVGGLLALIAADPHWWLEAIFTALGTAAGVATIPLLRVFIGESEPFQRQLVVVLAVVAAAAAIMSPLLVPLARWCLRMRRPEWKQPIGEPSP